LTALTASNTGYKTWRGEKLSGDKIWQLFEGLLENQLTAYSHVLTGTYRGVIDQSFIFTCIL